MDSHFVQYPYFYVSASLRKSMRFFVRIFISPYQHYLWKFKNGNEKEPILFHEEEKTYKKRNKANKKRILSKPTVLGFKNQRLSVSAIQALIG